MDSSCEYFVECGDFNTLIKSMDTGAMSLIIFIRLHGLLCKVEEAIYSQINFYGLDVVILKSQYHYLELDEIILKFTWMTEKARRAKKILTKKVMDRSFDL